jgi:pimeloyl-ACP methyl ester carboxylesterase
LSADLPFAARVVRLPSSPAPLEVPPAPASESASLRVAIAGEGPAVVLIPGLLGSSFGYRKLIPKLVEAGGAADKSWVTDEVVDGYMAAGARDLGATLRVYKRMANAREPEPLAPRLGQVRIPVRLLMGAVPHQGGPDEAEIQTMRRALPTLVVERLPGVGHYPYEEDPGAVVRAIRTALSEGRAP